MITVRPSAERLQTRIGWLDSRHTFSFAEHYDPRYMGYRALRVINEDRIAPGRGFGMHPRRDIEIVTCVLSGAIRHDDSLGIAAIVKPGDVQRITAGTGVLHREFNASDTEPVHLIQIWIAPYKMRLRPSYEQRHFPDSGRFGRLTLIASHDGRQSSVVVHQDMTLSASILGGGDRLTHVVANDRHVWLHVIKGCLVVNDVTLRDGDGAAVTAEPSLCLIALTRTEFLIFDLA
jgi:redox-sensitive bicupin YhaK (pirin superfamily)